MTDPSTSVELARISAALVAAIANAKSRLASGSLDGDFCDLMQYARELHDLMREVLISNPAAGEYAQEPCAIIGGKLDDVEVSVIGDSR